MNPFVKSLIGVVARLILTVAAGAGFIASEDFEPLAELIVQLGSAMVLAGVGLWSAYQKYRDRKKLTTALASATPMSEASMEKKIAAGLAAPVTTSADAVPVITMSQP
jgi:Tfp pilus assembly major pilin PilA